MRFHPLYTDKILGLADDKLADDAECCCPCAIDQCVGLKMTLSLNGFRDYFQDNGAFPGSSVYNGYWSVLSGFSTTDVTVNPSGDGVGASFHLGTHLNPADKGIRVRRWRAYNFATVLREVQTIYVYQIDASLACYSKDVAKCFPIPSINCLEPQFGLDRTVNFQGTYLKLYYQIWDFDLNDWAISQQYFNFGGTMGAGSNVGSTRIYGKWKGPPDCKTEDPNAKALTIDTLQEGPGLVVYQNLSINYDLRV